MKAETIFGLIINTSCLDELFCMKEVVNTNRTATRTHATHTYTHTHRDLETAHPDPSFRSDCYFLPLLLADFRVGPSFISIAFAAV
jgi:hypothetical protein